jgi:alpha-amylase
MYPPRDAVDFFRLTSWADVDRDLTAWIGNQMQDSAIHQAFELRDQVLATGDPLLIQDWRKLLTSDHFYYMCTKWAADGDVHAYFSPYENPYEAFVNYMNALRGLMRRIEERQLRDEQVSDIAYPGSHSVPQVLQLQR